MVLPLSWVSSMDWAWAGVWVSVSIADVAFVIRGFRNAPQNGVSFRKVWTRTRGCGAVGAVRRGATSPTQAGTYLAPLSRQAGPRGDSGHSIALLSPPHPRAPPTRPHLRATLRCS